MNSNFPKMNNGFVRPQYSLDNKQRIVAVVPNKKSFSLRRLVVFAFLGLALVFGIQSLVYVNSAQNAKGKILGQATTAYSDLNNASKNLAGSDFSSAQNLFESAQSNLSLAQSQLDNFKVLTWLVPQASSADHLLSGANLLAQSGQKLTEALAIFDELKVSSEGVENSFNEKVLANRNLLSESLNLILQSSYEFNQISSVPADYSQTLDKAKEQVTQLSLILKKLVDLEDLYLSLFSGSKTYLLVFQNYDEARATGGFIGTYGVLKTNNGKIDQLKIESVYNLDGRITKLIAAPGPFQPAIKKWGMRDANWFVDFPTSAKKLLEFFELGSQTADGVLSLTPQLFENLLNLIGPIEMPEYEVTLTAENFQEVVQQKTSVDYDLELNQPKKFLADFAPRLLDRLTSLTKDQWFSFLEILENNLQQKQILVFSKNSETQKHIDTLGFSGRILPTDYDYLAIINSNLGGTKTDLSIKQTVTLQSKILSDSSIVNTLTISRKNNSEELNKNYLRILVPLGSQLISESGFKSSSFYNSESKGYATDPDLALWDIGKIQGNVYIREEAGKTEFAGWAELASEEEQVITLTYILPFKLADNQGYSLLLQKQSGSKPFEFMGSVNLGQFNSSWSMEGIVREGNSLKFTSNLNTDDFWGFVLTK